MNGNHYKQFWGSKKISKAYIKKLIKFDFKQLIEKVDGGHKMIGSSKKLISPSSILKPFRDCKFFGIPNNVMEQRRIDGSVLMENLEKVFIQKKMKFDEFDITLKQKKDIFNLFNYFINNGIKLIAVEKPITNGIVYGIIDCIVKKDSKYYVMEIKLRNNLTIENSDRLQAKIYSELMELPCIVLCLSDNGEVVTETLLKTDFQSELRQIENMYKLFGIELDFKQKLKVE